MISVSRVTRRFQTRGGLVVAVDDVTFEVERNSFFTLLGPSGCGKSTLLRCVAGLETPDQGEIRIGERLVFSSSSGVEVLASRRQVGMVFQTYAVWPHMTVFKNVAFPLEVQRRRDIRSRVMRALTMVGLEAEAERYASRLSGGQQQRVALARAIVAEPDVLLLDEPLSNLDASLREQMRGELRNLQQTLNVTTLYVTHDQAEALSMSDRIAVMRSGRFVEVASPEELYHHPKSVFTAGFIGGANIVPGSRQAGSSACGPTAIVTPAGVFWSSDGSEGERATLFIRPEKIRILEGGSRGGEDLRNRFSAMVKSRRFGGESSEVEVIVEGPANRIVLRCKVRGDSRLKAGERVEIVVDPDDVHILALA